MTDTTLRSGSRPWDWLPFFSQAGWERFGDLAGLPQGVPLQWLDGPRLIEVQHEIELLWQPRMEVVTDPLVLGQIQDADPARSRTKSLSIEVLPALSRPGHTTPA